MPVLEGTNSTILVQQQEYFYPGNDPDYEPVSALRGFVVLIVGFVVIFVLLRGMIIKGWGWDFRWAIFAVAVGAAIINVVVYFGVGMF